MIVTFGMHCVRTRKHAFQAAKGMFCPRTQEKSSKHPDTLTHRKPCSKQQPILRLRRNSNPRHPTAQMLSDNRNCRNFECRQKPMSKCKHFRACADTKSGRLAKIDNRMPGADESRVSSMQSGLADYSRRLRARTRQLHQSSSHSEAQSRSKPRRRIGWSSQKLSSSKALCFPLNQNCHLLWIGGL